MKLSSSRRPRAAGGMRTYTEIMSADGGYVIGAQVGAFSGERDTHLNLFVRYARGIAAYGDFANISTSGSTYNGPTGQILPDLTTAGAHEFLVAAGGNWEAGPFGLTPTMMTWSNV